MFSSSADWLSSLVTNTFGNDGQLSRKVSHICFIALTVVLLQAAFQKYIFECPERGYRHFSLIFFFAPAFPLFCISWLSNVDLQNGIRGVCYRCWNRADRMRSWRRVRWLSLCSIVFTSHLNAYVAPFFWFVMCLLNKKIMTCYLYGPSEPNNTDFTKRHYVTLQTYSQLIGFDLLLITAAVVTIFVTIKECFKQANPGKVIPEFEVLDNYASYEADAARAHFEEVMKQTAEENGRKKVQMLLEAKQPNLDHLQGVDREIEGMSYDYLVDVRNSLMKIYPKLKNEYDTKLQYYTIDEWKKEEKVFRKQLSKSSHNAHKEQNEKKKRKKSHDGSIDMTTDGEQIHLLEYKDKRTNANYEAADA